MPDRSIDHNGKTVRTFSDVCNTDGHIGSIIRTVITQIMDVKLNSNKTVMIRRDGSSSWPIAIRLWYLFSRLRHFRNVSVSERNLYTARFRQRNARLRRLCLGGFMKPTIAVLRIIYWRFWKLRSWFWRFSRRRCGTWSSSGGRSICMRTVPAIAFRLMSYLIGSMVHLPLIIVVNAFVSTASVTL